MASARKRLSRKPDQVQGCIPGYGIQVVELDFAIWAEVFIGAARGLFVVIQAGQACEEGCPGQIKKRSA